VEAILRAAVRFARDDPELIRIYLVCTTGDLSGLSEQLSSSIEHISARRPTIPGPSSRLRWASYSALVHRTLCLGLLRHHRLYHFSAAGYQRK